MKLLMLLNALEGYEMDGNPELEISGLAYDSRKVQPGNLFVAIRGHALDGHRYLRDALTRGAAALVGESLGDVPAGVPAIRVPDSRRALARLAAQFYVHPHQDLTLIGITGTNGKTTTSYLLESILLAANRRAGVIGTINYRIGGETLPATVTTPESLDLMRLLRRMADRGASDVIMEVSSHALDQGRTGDCAFHAGVFTNLTRDHLDYHGTMEAYFEAKSRLFGLLDREGSAVINADDPMGRKLADRVRGKVLTYGLMDGADVGARILSASADGLRMVITTAEGDREVRSSLLGRVNAYNILAAAATARALGVKIDAVERGLERVKAVPGRLERVGPPGPPVAVVDYAHTPDALLKALQALKPLTTGRIISVFGCGGDRDRGKRYEMGLVAGEQSDLVVLTSDNPRSEDPLAIVEEIRRGVLDAGMEALEPAAPVPRHVRGYLLEVDRRRAIRRAFELAGDDDLILIAGKGHEDYQIIGGRRRPFDDREEAVLAARGGS